MTEILPSGKLMIPGDFGLHAIMRNEKRLAVVDSLAVECLMRRMDLVGDNHAEILKL